MFHGGHVWIHWGGCLADLNLILSREESFYNIQHWTRSCGVGICCGSSHDRHWRWTGADMSLNIYFLLVSVMVSFSKNKMNRLAALKYSDTPRWTGIAPGRAQSCSKLLGHRCPLSPEDTFTSPDWQGADHKRTLSGQTRWRLSCSDLRWLGTKVMLSRRTPVGHGGGSAMLWSTKGLE